MTGPCIFITTYAIKEGQLEGFREFVDGLLGVLEANMPRAYAINAYLSPDGTEASIVQITPDANAIKDYWRAVHQQTGRALERFVESPKGVQIYGATGDFMLERTRHSAGSGVAVSVMPEHLGGFSRMGERPSDVPGGVTKL